MKASDSKNEVYLKDLSVMQGEISIIADAVHQAYLESLKRF